MEMLCILMLTSVFILAQSEFLCDEKFPIVTDFGLDDCDNKDKLFYNPKKYQDCLPGCDEYDRNYCIQGKCPLGYTCEERSCIPDESSCMKYHTDMYETTNSYLKTLWKPQCSHDGSWKAKQCKRDRCFCFDDNGNRIFGDAFYDEADDMTCECSRRRAELENSLNQFFVSLHCDSLGNYEPLQCDSGQCWCVEEKTGDLTSTVVPENLMKRLPCYNSTTIGDQYLRQCESQLYAQEKVRDEFDSHGHLINFDTLKCLYDGSYGPFKVIGNINYCVWKDDTQIGSYQSIGTAARKIMDCNCAKDKKLYELSGRIHLLVCEENGSYKSLQHFEDQYYCVDNDGIRRSEICTEEVDAATCADQSKITCDELTTPSTR